MKKAVFPVGMLLVTCWLLAAGAARAQSQPSYIELDALIVEGQIQRPQAVYIIQRARLDFGAAVKKQSFVNKVKESIREEPF